MIVALGCLAAVVAAVIQRVTGLAFVLVLIGPVVLIYGPIEGVTVAVLLAPGDPSSVAPRPKPKPGSQAPRPATKR